MRKMQFWKLRQSRWEFKFVEVFHTIHPPQKLSVDSAREAMSVNGITPEMLEGAPMLYQIIPSLQEFIGYALRRPQSGI